MAVIKIVELIGSSPNSWMEAAQNAVTRSSKTIRGVKSLKVKGFTARCANGKIVEYRANVKVAFEVEEPKGKK